MSIIRKIRELLRRVKILIKNADKLDALAQISFDLERCNSRIDLTKHHMKIYANKIIDLESKINDPEFLGDRLMKNSKYIESINNVVSAHVDLDAHKFSQKMKMANLRATKNYDHIMSIVKTMVTDITENYIIKKYKSTESMSYNTLTIYEKDKIEDLNMIYNLFLHVSAVEIISEDLATYYDMHSLNTKEFFIGRFIAPIYQTKMAQYIAEFKMYADSKTIKSDINFDEHFGEKTETEKAIDNILGQG